MKRFRLITEHCTVIITISLYEVLHFSLELHSIFPENRVKRNIKTQNAQGLLKDNTMECLYPLAMCCFYSKSFPLLQVLISPPSRLGIQVEMGKVRQETEKVSSCSVGCSHWMANGHGLRLEPEHLMLVSY